MKTVPSTFTNQTECERAWGEETAAIYSRVVENRTERVLFKQKDKIKKKAANDYLTVTLAGSSDS